MELTFWSNRVSLTKNLFTVSPPQSLNRKDFLFHLVSQIILKSQNNDTIYKLILI